MAGGYGLSQHPVKARAFADFALGLVAVPEAAALHDQGYHGFDG